jgi:hypothetical protein
MTFGTLIFSFMPLRIKGLYVTFSISYTQHSNNLPLYWVSFSSESCFIYYYARIIILNGIIKSVYESISTFLTTTKILEMNFASPGHAKHRFYPILVVPYCPMRQSLVLQLSLSWAFSKVVNWTILPMYNMFIKWSACYKLSPVMVSWHA